MKKIKFIVSLMLIFTILFPYTNTVFAVYENELVNTIKQNSEELQNEVLADNTSISEEENKDEAKEEFKVESNKTEKNEIVENVVEDDKTIVNNVEEKNITVVTENVTEKNTNTNNEKNNQSKESVNNEKEKINSKTESTITTKDKKVESVQVATKGILILDTLQDGKNITTPITEYLRIAGWAVANDANVKIKLYINGVCWLQDMKRTSRPDINSISNQYSGVTKKAGYEENLYVGSLPEGKHTVRIDQVDSKGKVISSLSRTLVVHRENFKSTMCIDTPNNNQTLYVPSKKNITVSGWAISTESKAKIKIYVDNTLKTENVNRYSRPDVNKISAPYGGTSTTKNAGFSANINIENLQEGTHKIKVEQVDRSGKTIDLQEKTIYIKSGYRGILLSDTLQDGKTITTPTTEYLRVAGWAVSDDPNVKIKLYINGACWLQNMKRTSRPDINSISNQYGGATKNAGYEETIYVGALPEGRHIVRIDQVDSRGKVVSSISKTLVVHRENFRGTMCIDAPSNNKTIYSLGEKVLNISGWAVSTEPKAKIKIYMDNTLITENANRGLRPDVNSIANQYGGTSITPKSGFSASINVEKTNEGTHKIKVEQVDRSGKTINSQEKTIYIKAGYRGILLSDTLQDGKTITTPTTEYLRVSGWAVSDDPNVKIKLYINGACWLQNMKRTSRPDINSISNQYGGATKNAGYEETIYVGALPEGRHIVRIDQVDSRGKVISSISKTLVVHRENFRGTMCIDAPSNNQKIYVPSQKNIKVSGWAVSTEPKAKIRIYMDNTLITENANRYSRPDVNSIANQYGGTSVTPKSGYSANINVEKLQEGTHKIKVEQIDRSGKVINSQVKNVYIKSNYKGILTLDTVLQNGLTLNTPSTENLRVAGWAVSDDPNAKISLYIDNGCWIKEMKRTSRPDINSISNQYGGVTKNAGYEGTINILGLTEGSHLLKIEQVDSRGKIISTFARTIIVKREKFRGIVCIDSPISGQLYNKTNHTLQISGWTLSTDAGDSVQIKINGAVQNVNRFERSDLNSKANEYGGVSKNKTPGYKCSVDVSNYGEGIYNIEINIISRWGEIIESVNRNIEISFSRYAGVDVSVHNGKVDWQRLKNQGIEFAILRIGYGQNDSQKDSTFEYNYSECKKYGIKVGVYLYSYAMSVEDSDKEANNCLNWLKGRQLDLPVYYDIENDNGSYRQDSLSKETLTNMALTFLNKVSNSGYKAGFYSSKYWLEAKLDMSQIENNYSVWVAHYTSLVQTTYKGKYDIWQWIDGKNDNTLGGFDRNWCYRKSLMQ